MLGHHRVHFVIQWAVTSAYASDGPLDNKGDGGNALSLKTALIGFHQLKKIIPERTLLDRARAGIRKVIFVIF